LIDLEIKIAARRNLFDNRGQGNPNQLTPQLFQEAEIEEANQTQNHNQRRTIGDLISYASLRDFASIMRPTMIDRIVALNLALLQLISSHQVSSMDHEDPHTYLYTF